MNVVASSPEGLEKYLAEEIANLGGFNIRMDVLGGYTKESYKWNISDMDKHPSAKGQEKIAEFLYERL